MITHEINCAECGKTLRIEASTGPATVAVSYIPPCDVCRTRAVDVAYDEGFQAGQESMLTEE